MQIPEDLVKLYNLNPDYECYDNSTLATIDSCVRKAYWKLLFPLPGAEVSGIQDRVGVAAHFGTSIHSAMDKMYSPVLYRTHTLEQRRIAAFRAFSLKYQELITEPDLVDEVYSHPTGVRLLDDYFNFYAAEDGFFTPVETELCSIVLLGDLDPPAYYIARIDGTVARPSQADYLVREFKTTKSSLQSKLDELRISRQCEGYVWSLRQHDAGQPISGVMADILAVRVRERDPSKLFLRDIIHISPLQAAQWHRETIIKIRRWRSIRAYANETTTNPLTQHFFFDRNTGECLRYGKCSYYELCAYGLNSVDLQKFLPNDWNPLHAEKMTNA